MKKILFIFLLFPSLTLAATLKDDAYELDVTYQKKQKEQEPQKLHLKLGASSLQSIHLFYSKDQVQKEDASQFIQVQIQDVRSLTFVGSDTDQPFLLAELTSR